jgi:hypothetical protein
MHLEEIIREIEKLPENQIAQIVALIVPKCILEPINPGENEYLPKITYLKDYFKLWERCGFHVTINHYYSSIPDTSKLPATLWDKQDAMPGIDFQHDKQLELLKEFKNRYFPEYDSFPLENTADPNQYYLSNYLFEAVDSHSAYCLVRHLKPKKLVEIGGGFSSLVFAQACRNNLTEGHPVDYTVIEPYPRNFLRRGIPGINRLIDKEVQNVDLGIFDQLEPGDILSMDTSHVLKIGGDVKHDYTAILPHLKPGVIIHIHDIFLPAEYPVKMISGGFFPNEQYLVQAILVNNRNFEILWASLFMCLHHFPAVSEAFPVYNRETMSKWQLPSSIWLKKTS